MQRSALGMALGADHNKRMLTMNDDYPMTEEYQPASARADDRVATVIVVGAVVAALTVAALVLPPEPVDVPQTFHALGNGVGASYTLPAETAR